MAPSGSVPTIRDLPPWTEPGADATLLERILPFGGFGKPEDVADAIAFLASDDAKHINGTMLRIDGGMCS